MISPFVLSFHYHFLSSYFFEVEKYRPFFIALGPVIALLSLLFIYVLRRGWCLNSDGRLRCKSRALVCSAVLEWCCVTLHCYLSHSRQVFRCTHFLPHLSFTLFYCLGRAVRPPDAAVPLPFFQLLIVEACDLFDRICAANCPCWFAPLKIIIVLTLIAIFFAFASIFLAFVVSSYMIVISIVFAVGYSVA